MRLNYDAVIFDMDGTLTNSRNAIVSSINYARNLKGLESLDALDIMEKVNTLTYDSAFVFYGESPSEADHAHFEERYAMECRYIKAYSGIKELLERLTTLGLKLAVATNATKHFAELTLANAGLIDFFASIVGATCIPRPKPAPDMLLHTLDVLRIADKKRAVFVGDSGKDMQAAKAAGVEAVFVSWGYGTENQLADHTIDKPEDLLKIIGG